MGAVLREALQLPRDPLLRHPGQEDRAHLARAHQPLRQDPHTDQRAVRQGLADPGIPRRLSRRGHPAHRAIDRGHLRHRRDAAREAGALPRYARRLLRARRRARAQPWRGPGAAQAQQDPHRRRGRGQGPPRGQAAADLHRDRHRPDLLRDHPEERQPGLRRGQLPRAVRVDRGRPDCPRGDMKYLSGFGAHHESEAIKGALPIGQNSPQQVPFGLYAEQLSGSAFTAPRAGNLRSWLYRLRPSAMHSPFRRVGEGQLRTAPCLEVECSPNRLRWAPQAAPAEGTDFIAAMTTFATCGDARAQRGAAVHLYAANPSLDSPVFYNPAPDLLSLPQEGALTLFTEFGQLPLAPGEIAVIPRGVKFRVELADGAARGYVCENYCAPFRLPDLGPIRSNGPANPPDFLPPAAAFEDRSHPTEVISTPGRHPRTAHLDHAPPDL